MSKGIVEEVGAASMIAGGILIGAGTFGAMGGVTAFMVGHGLTSFLIYAGSGMAMQPIGTMLDPKEPRQCQSI